MKSTEPITYTPGQLIKQRFLKNYPAVAGVVIIMLFVLIALSGYLIMPDDTPNANLRLPEIRKKEPGFSIEILKIKKNRKIEDVGFFDYWMNGEPEDYIGRPIKDWSFSADSLWIEVSIYEGERSFKTEKYHILDVAYPVSILTKESERYQELNDDLVYVGVDEQKHQVSRIDAVAAAEKHVVSRSYLLGTDINGRDVLSKLIFGTRISLAIGLLSVVIAVFVGVFLGALAGYFRGWVDSLIMWFMTVVWSIPRIMLVIALSMALQSDGVWTAFVAVGLTMWVEIARVVRGQMIEIRERQFVEAAKSYGASEWRIIFRHILPNIIGPLVVVITANFADAILIEAGLSFLGLGVQPPMPSWGLMVQEGFAVITSPGCWHLIFFPALCISLLVLSFNLLGNGLRDAFDPKTSN